MRLGCALIAMAILPSLLPAQDSPAANPQFQVKPDDFCTVEGVVVNSVTASPIKNVSVSIRHLSAGGGGSSAVTDINGHFAFQNLVPGRYVVQTSGFGPNWTLAGSNRAGSHRILTLDRGRHVKDVILRLQPGGVITGTVYDEDSQPAVGAQVQAYEADSSMRSGFSVGGQTNDLGEYRIFGIPAGKYYVVATGRRDFNSEASANEVYLPTIYPGTSDAGQALPVEVHPGGEQSGIDVGLILTKGVSVRGRAVMSVAGTPSTNAFVMLVPRDSPANLPRQLAQYASGTQKDGSFEIRAVPPGNYLLSANSSNGKDFYHGQIPLDVGTEDLDGVTVTLSPGFALQGRITADPGAEFNFAQLNLYLESMGPAGIGVGAAKISADGSFAFEKAYEGEYRLHVNGFPKEFYVRSAKWGADDALAGFTVSTSEGGLLNIDLALDGGCLDGVVLQDGQPVPNAFVTLIPDPPNRDRDDLYSQTSSDALGRFSMLGLPPGEFKLFAWEPGQSVNDRNPEFMKIYEKRGAHVHIEAKKQETLQLELTLAEDEPQ